jgi:hypothetical protein
MDDKGVAGLASSLAISSADFSSGSDADSIADTPGAPGFSVGSSDFSAAIEITPVTAISNIAVSILLIILPPESISLYLFLKNKFDSAYLFSA